MNPRFKLGPAIDRKMLVIEAGCEYVLRPDRMLGADDVEVRIDDFPFRNPKEDQLRTISELAVLQHARIELWDRHTRICSWTYAETDTPDAVEGWLRGTLLQLRSQPESEAFSNDGSSISDKQTAQHGITRFWDLFSVILPQSVRERVYEPARQELLDDYLSVRGKFPTKWGTRWINFAFTVRIAVMVAQSLRAWLGDKALAWLWWLLIAVVGDGVVRGLRCLFFQFFGRL